jgi:hypothetical protein
MKIIAGKSAPWREHLPMEFRFDVHDGKTVRCAEGGHALPDPSRPMVWHEIVRDGRVVIRSRKPASTLLSLLGKGEMLYRARRKNRGSSVTNVIRTLVARRSV